MVQPIDGVLLFYAKLVEGQAQIFTGDDGDGVLLFLASGETNRGPAAFTVYGGPAVFILGFHLLRFLLLTAI